MKSFRINKEIEIVCEAKRTRNGFSHIATLLLNGIERDKVKINYTNRTWERYEYQSILQKLIDKTTIFSDTEYSQAKDFVENYKEKDNGFGVIGMAMMMGEIFHAGDKPKINDWKIRMLKAGLENRGLIMPDDWDSLSEEVKEKRMNGVISVLKDNL